jgi:seryl-tRNA synthetase
MIDPKTIREKTSIVSEGLEKRGATFDIEKLLATDEKRRRLIQ